jgi:AcrR family transcriptional regulator
MVHSAAPGATKKEVVAEFRRGEILQAARRVFARRGFRPATVDEIAVEAGIAKGTLYLYFESKEAIYLKALLQDVTTLREETIDRLSKATGTRAKISEFIAVRSQHSRKNADFWRVYFSEFSNLATGTTPASKPFQAELQQSIDLLAGIVRDGVSRKEIRDVEPLRTAYAITDLMRAVIERRLMGFVKSTAEEEVAFVMELLWNGIGYGKKR